jgi:hypothetical protein
MTAGTTGRDRSRVLDGPAIRAMQMSTWAMDGGEAHDSCGCRPDGPGPGRSLRAVARCAAPIGSSHRLEAVHENRSVGWRRRRGQQQRVIAPRSGSRTRCRTRSRRARRPRGHSGAAYFTFIGSNAIGYQSAQLGQHTSPRTAASCARRPGTATSPHRSDRITLKLEKSPSPSFARRRPMQHAQDGVGRAPRLHVGVGGPPRPRASSASARPPPPA